VDAPCAKLRTKGMFIPQFAPVPALSEASSTAVFWCVKTMKVTGPDSGAVAPDRCLPSRRCYDSDLPETSGLR